MPSFAQQLPTLLRLLADPVTPHTAAELWCRIQATGWAECAPVLESELETGSPDVKRLVLGILSEEAEHVGVESTQPFTAAIERLLSEEDRLVRVAAIRAVRDLHLGTPSTITSLRRMISSDDLLVTREAVVALLDLDDRFLNEAAQVLRQPLG